LRKSIDIRLYQSALIIHSHCVGRLNAQYRKLDSHHSDERMHDAVPQWSHDNAIKIQPGQQLITAMQSTKK